MSTCIMPSASAPSVPGRGWRWRSAVFAVCVRYGSMHTMKAPRFRACFTSDMRLMWV